MTTPPSPPQDLTVPVTPQTASSALNLFGEKSPTGGFSTTRGAFSALLAPLTKENFREVISNVEQQLRSVKQVFSMLDLQEVDSLLQEMLIALTRKTGELLGADRATVFLLDEDRGELWSVVAQSEGKTLEIRIPSDRGIAGEVARTRQTILIPHDFYDDPRSVVAREQEKRTGYRTYTMLALPLLDSKDHLVAVVQLLNKLTDDNKASDSLAERITATGFTEQDQELFAQFAPSIRLVLEISRHFYEVSQQQRAAVSLMKAIRSLSQCTLDLEDTLKRVMFEAKELMAADRSTLWLLDRDRQELWTKVPLADGSLKELRVPLGMGYVGKVGVSGQRLNIPFDLYDDPDSETAKKFDQATGYRTCSLLCMPVLNSDGKMIGVTQLVNKRRQGEFPPYNPADWPKAPDCFKASFQRSDEAFMETFNIQAGVALQNAQLFATVKQQEQMQRDILRSLTNGVLSTDKTGCILAANESAHRLLGFTGDAHLEGRVVAEVVQIAEGDFPRWFQTALEASGEKDRQQYYPDRTLIDTEGKQHSVDLSLNTIYDAADPTQVRGILVVLDDISDEKRLKNTMYRYMTQELAEELLKLDDAGLGGDRKEVSILFSDIRSYTTLTESLEAEEVVRMLNQYFELMVEAIFHYKGTLDKFIGDAIMAVFGSPLNLEEHAWMSVQTAIDMRHRLEGFNTLRKEQGLMPIQVGVGINSDVVISGHIGSSKRMEFTAIGDGVNLASRLEGVTKMYGCDVIISENTYQHCADRLCVRELDFIRVKGKTRPVAIYELVAIHDGPLARPVPENKLRVIEHYRRAREYYLQRKFVMANKQFETVLGIDGKDKAAILHLQRCEHWMQKPPPEDWDGAWTLTEK